jgi:hypothetical protein
MTVDIRVEITRFVVSHATSSALQGQQFLNRLLLWVQAQMLLISLPLLYVCLAPLDPSACYGLLAA